MADRLPGAECSAAEAEEASTSPRQYFVGDRSNASLRRQRRLDYALPMTFVPMKIKVRMPMAMR